MNQEALAIEFEKRKIPFIREKRLEVTYKRETLSKYYEADFVCYNKIIVETKAISELVTKHKSQVINYLKATNLNLGILINFGGESLEYERLIRH